MSGEVRAETVGEWLGAVQPPPPKALLGRLRELMSPHADRPASEAPEACLQVGETRLKSLLAEGATDRESALDLLAIDALVTYAFEAAVHDPTRLEALADDAMARIAGIPEAT